MRGRGPNLSVLREKSAGGGERACITSLRRYYYRQLHDQSTNMPPIADTKSTKSRKKIAQIKKRISGMDYLSPATLLKRM